MCVYIYIYIYTLKIFMVAYKMYMIIGSPYNQRKGDNFKFSINYNIIFTKTVCIAVSTLCKKDGGNYVVELLGNSSRFRQ